MERRRLLVTGCGRSGTAYATVVWRAVGLDVRHEMPVPPNGTMGRDGIASWYMAVDDPQPPYGPSARGYVFDMVIHQVRDPLRVIPSVAQFILNHPASRAYIERNAPATRLDLRDAFRRRRDRLLLQAMRYWLHWNRLAAAKAHETVQVERLISSLPRLCERLGISLPPESTKGIATDINARSNYVDGAPWSVDWSDLERLDDRLSQDIAQLAASYGY